LATFQAQVEGITSLSVGTTPTTGELTQFLVDGVKEVVNRIMKYDPSKAILFTKSTDITDNSGTTVDSGIVLSVTRENGTVGNDEPASPISPAQRYRATDATSLHYRTKYNPGWYILDGKVFVVPAPIAGAGDHAQINYVTYDTGVAFGGSTIANMPDEYEYLVVLYACMRTIHAVMGNTTLSDLTITAVTPDAPTLASVTYSGPSADLDATGPTVAFTGVAISDVLGSTTLPAYTGQSVTTQSTFKSFFDDTTTDNPLGDNDPGTFVLSPVTPDFPTLTSISFADINTNNASFTAVTGDSVLTSAAPTTNVPTYTQPAIDAEAGELVDMRAGSSKIDFNDWFDQAGDYIETDEDTELAASQLSKIGTYISAYSASMNNQLHEFNEANTKFQASVQESMANFQSKNQQAIGDAERLQNKELQNGINSAKATYDNNAQSIQQFQQELADYQAVVNAEVQEYSQKLTRYNTELQTILQAWQKIESDNIAIFQANIQNEVNEFNEANVKYQASVQESIGEFQAQNQKNIAQAQHDLQIAVSNEDRSQQRQIQNAVNEMQSKINDNQNLITKYQADIQEYQAAVGTEVQEYTQNIQADGVGYQWLQDQYTKIKQEYDMAFMPKPQPREEVPQRG